MATTASVDSLPMYILLYDGLIAEQVVTSSDQSPTYIYKKPAPDMTTSTLPRQCGICLQLLAADEMSQHCETHCDATEMERPYKCTMCPKAYAQQSTLCDHMRRHFGVLPYDCNECDSAFSTSKDLRQHNATRHAKFSYACSDCDKSFAQKCGLQRHYDSMHAKQRQFKCQKCAKAFTERYNLKQHMLSVHEGVPIRRNCAYCGEIFTHASQLTAHRRTHEGQVLDCGPCGERFHSLKKFDQHALTLRHRQRFQMQSQQTNENEFLADSEDSSNEVIVLDHEDFEQPLKSDTEQLAYKCSYCTNTYSKPSLLANHLRRHLGVYEYACTACNVAFVTVKDLREHTTRRHAPALYACDKCERRYAQQHALRRHQATAHEQIRPHQCAQCSKAFAQKANLKAHERSVHGGQPLHRKCSYCAQTFTHSSKLTAHRKLHEHELLKCDLCNEVFEGIKNYDCHKTTVRHRHRVANIESRDSNGTEIN